MSKAETPLMAQYAEIKAAHPGALLLFRVGDFYETFDEDAVKASRILGIVLTKRSNGAAADMPLAGFPHHALETYLPRLVRAGERVAICEQLEDPKTTKKVVKRGVTELVTPGVHMRDNLLLAGSNNFLAAWNETDGNGSLAFVDVSTGEFLVADQKISDLSRLLSSFEPKEVLVPNALKKRFVEIFGEGFYLSTLPDWACKSQNGQKALLQHFQVASLKGFGLETHSGAWSTAGMLLHYLNQNGQDRLGHISNIQLILDDAHLWLDRFTLRNLEVIEAGNPDGWSLLQIIDHASTPMGKRMLRRWLSAPLRNKKPIESRQEKVDFFTKLPELLYKTRDWLEQMPDLERSVSRLASGRIHPRELHHLARAFKLAQTFTAAEDMQGANLVFENLKPALERIESCLHPDPAAQLGKGRIIKPGFSAELDEVLDLLHNGKKYLQNLLERETEISGISSLKLGFNNVFGYYLEVRNTHKDKVPVAWIRKQTLVSAERYITQELKQYEEKILNAEEKTFELEQQIYETLVNELQVFIGPLMHNARLLGELDAFANFALLAINHGYVKPEFVEDISLELTEARHPVIEQSLPAGTAYVSNSLQLDSEKHQILMITGPNMSGKSALLRQVALSCLLAQTGCYVPAHAAKLPILDRLFVRVGASDNISRGESTFMVEMSETASILNNLAGNCLVLLDEIGRGTSTYDGVSIAWAIAAFLHEHPARPLTLFATHYHELNEMEKTHARIKNLHVQVKEVGKEVIFLRKLQPGGTAHSFGIHVARMAGMPQFVLRKSEEMLRHFELSKTPNGLNKPSSGIQLSLVQMDDPLLMEIKDLLKGLDVNTLTPVEALIFLHDIQKRMKAEK